jgi:anti-sigma regulatory factor (Ser/Thr protein kinase)
MQSRAPARGTARAPARDDERDSLVLSLRGEPEAAGVARRALTRLRGLEVALMDTMRLLVTELVANSVKHAQAEALELKVVVANGAVVVEVTDEGPGFEPTPRSARGGDAGWGLYLVERLAHRWGVHREGQSTRVWFELRR